MAVDESPLLLERDGAVLRLVLNRPAQGNALDLSLGRALMLAAIEADEDPSVRCVLLTGRGRMFCAGGDIHAFAAAGDRLGAFIKELTGYLHLAMSRLARMPKPLVTAVNGPAAGAGLSLAVLGDIALGGRSSHLTLAYTALGVSPDGGSTWLLPRLIGLRRTQELMLLNRRVEAEEAASLGLLTRVVPDEALEAEGMAVARTLAAGATAALGRTRALLLDSLGAGFEEQMEREARSIAAAASGAEGREGIGAFLGRRRAEFGGK